MSPDSFGRTLFADLAFRGQSYKIMVRSLTAGYIETFARN